MPASLRMYFLVSLAAVGLGLFTQETVIGSGPPNGFPIRDDGKFFSAGAKQKAQSTIGSIKRDFRKDLLIETFPEVPGSQKARMDSMGKDKFFAAFAREQYDQQKVEGVAVIICKNPSHLQVVEGVGQEKAFTPENRKALRDLLMSRFREKDFDGGLLACASFVEESFRKNIPPSAATRPLIPAAIGTSTSDGKEKGGAAAKQGQENSLMGLLCVGLALLMGVWMLVGLVRAFSGANRPAYGPQQGGPGGPPPGGYAGYPQPQAGGGFLRNMLGGMLGGAAGMWIYDSFFRGGSSFGGGMSPPAYGGGGPSGSTGDVAGGTDGGDWGDSGNSGGGDWSDAGDSGGGDWGGGDSGGGDWGGGGDSGGGDW